MSDENVRRRAEQLKEQFEGGLGTWFNESSNPNVQPSSSSCLNFIGGCGFSFTSQSSSPSNPFSQRLPNDWVYDDYYNVLSKDFSGMSIFDEQGNDVKTRGQGVVDSYPYTYPQTPYSSLDASHAYNNIPEETVFPCQQQRTSNNVGTPNSPRGVSGASGLVPEVKWTLPPLAKAHRFGPQGESPLSHGNMNGYGRCQLQKSPPLASPNNPYDCVLGSQTRSFGRDVQAPYMFSQTMQPELGLNTNAPSSYYFPAARETSTPQRELARSLSPRRVRGSSMAFKCDNSFTIQDKDMKRYADSGCNSMWGTRKFATRNGVVFTSQVVGEEVPQLISRVVPIGGIENSSTLASDVTPPLLHNFDSWDKFQGSIYYMAKDQNGCRSLQRMVDEGTPEDRQRVFNGVIDYVVELMTDPFGNYLVQKLLDVCREDQRLQIVLMLTREPGKLVRTSLNSHGTRVVQKLIGTLNSRQQISLVRSAIQPGFLDLIKDLNGNHVIQRCLQCLSPQDNEFIFDAAAKFCVEIATHQHGCCVLQRCIDHSTGKCQDKLVKEICRHGLLLAQDPYGNYVVQYIIEMDNPSATAKLLSQFKGNYVNLSMQKFSSHVVEKCLKEVQESRSRIVQELLSVPHFEQLMQDPYANYVVQRALSVAKGSLLSSLVEAVRPHKMLRTSPYCKNIFSKDLLKK